MNDASGENIEEHARAAEPGGKKLPTKEDELVAENDEPHLDPSRWWFASSAFPMIAGTLGPVASAFSICALVRPWRQYYPAGSDVDNAAFIKDPIWLTVINAIQLAIALLANISLFLNMTRRLRFSIAQPVTIIGWYMSSICLVALAATASGPLVIQPKSEYIWSQAFYYGVYAAVLYFFVASLMLITAWGAYTGHYPRDFMLTPSQRTLMLQTILLLFYILLGALVFGRIEGWNYLDAVYWATVTLFTVGFGDYTASGPLGRALLIPYALIGIISLGLVIGSIRSLILDRGKRRLDARMVEKRRRKMLRQMIRKGKDDVLIPVKDKEMTESESQSDRRLTEFERREAEFKLMRLLQHQVARKRRWYALAISAGTWIALWLGGARVFQACEAAYQQWSYFDGVYFAYISLTTIGYGDITPVSNAGKSFWVFWALLALPTTTVLISNAGDTIVKGVRDTTDAVATITILPSDRPFKKDLKRFLRRASCGVLFREHIRESPPGFLGAANTDGSSSEDDDDDDGGNTMRQDQADLEAEAEATTGPSKAQKARHDQQREEDAEWHTDKVEANVAEETQHPSESQKKTIDTPSKRTSDTPSPSPRSRSRASTTKSKSKKPKAPRPIPSRKEDYHVALIDEIARVTSHLKHHPPKRYSFHEWAWYLRLIGEDEADAERHAKAKPHVQKKESSADGNNNDTEAHGPKDVARVQDEKEKPVSWSWVGSKSPLMGEKEEAEWILERLIQKLGDELRSVTSSREQTPERKSGESLRRRQTRSV
ncbi:outward-rectifier potassium channel TOK1 [Podospora australis]|uniref:Outward-rectifier potassium channel TOK1 n=1 Tax=Podospora australis TaxID=1536484 RepID=A0AAN7AKW9_9PEZI|nr:outward-rectifier potassium channel TOK1 [Podospora australis]